MELGLIKRKFTRQAPERWSEINAGQLIAIGMMYLGKTTDEDFLSRFLDIPKRICRKLDSFQIYCLVDVANFMSDFKPRENFIIKKVSGGIPPAAKLNKLSFGRFIFIDTYFNDYAIEGNDENALNKFIATLYWPARQKFNEELIQDRANQIAQINPNIKQAIAINYRLVKDWLALSYPAIFTSKASTNPERKKDNVWLKVYDSIVGDDLINHEKYAHLSLHDALRFITRKIKENVKG